MSAYRHACDLEHHNIHLDQGFSALIVVNTPAVDDSGVSHAVEHLVFRRSEAFNREESLFQLNALTDLAINASTHADITYYHCYSPNLPTCLLGLNYLLNGLFTPLFEQQDMDYEIYYDQFYGVINRELSYQQGEQQRVIDISDTSAHRCYQYGGDIELISQLNINDVIRYHAQHYQAKKMLLITGNIEPALVAPLLDCIDCNGKNDKLYHRKVLTQTHDYEANKQVFRWWIALEFFDYFSEHYTSLRTLIKSYHAQLMPLQYNPNNQQQFALDVIAPIDCLEETLFKALQEYLRGNTEVSSSEEQDKTQYKFSSEIMHLVNYHKTLNTGQASDACHTSGQNVVLSLGVATQFRLQKQPIINPIKTDKPNALLPVKNRLLTQLLHHFIEINDQNSQYKCQPLPTVFSTLSNKALQQLTENHNKIAKVFDEQHCLMLVYVKPLEENLAIITSFIISAYPSFLAARIQGHCYAIVCQYLDHSRHLAFYSAFDVAPMQRLAAMTKILCALKDDQVFIQQCLPLAIAKLNNTNGHNITAHCITTFLSNKICALHGQ